MAVTIHVNGKSNSLAHKGCMGISKSTIPDVCKTPTPGGPVPIPYPIIVSMSSDLKKGTKKVKVDGGKSAAIKGSELSRCSGDEPGTVGGIKSSTNMKEATWILYSFDVKLEGKNACRLSDKMMMNHGNTACLSGFIENPVTLVDFQMNLLCQIFCECLNTRDFSKKGTNVGVGVDHSVFDTPESIESKTTAFYNQICVEKELEGNPTLIAEQPFDMSTTPPSPISNRPSGHKRPDVVCLAAPGSPSGTNITRIVEMKFPGDDWNKGQKKAYERIAQENNPNATVEEMDEDSCKC